MEAVINTETKREKKRRLVREHNERMLAKYIAEDETKAKAELEPKPEVKPEEKLKIIVGRELFALVVAEPLKKMMAMRKTPEFLAFVAKRKHGRKRAR